MATFLVRWLGVFLPLMAGCAAADADGDGWPADSDCDDADAAVHPEADDLVGDGVDANCDGIDGVDDDGDGAASTASGGEDCDDAEPTTGPDADELCDQVDNDCNGLVDDTPVDGTTWFTDADGDGYGDGATAQEACDAPSGTVADGEDCDDLDDDVHPGADECLFDGIDNDCDATTTDGESTTAPEIAAVSCTGAGLVSWESGEVPALQFDVTATDVDGDLRLMSLTLAWDRDVDDEVDTDTENVAEATADQGSARCSGVTEADSSLVVLINGDDIAWDRTYEWSLTVTDSGGFESEPWLLACATPGEDGEGGGQ